MTKKGFWHPGHVSSLFPGLGLILRFASHDGHWTSTLTIFLVSVKIPEQDSQDKSTGLLSVPASTTVMQCGHCTFSPMRAMIVGW